MDGHIVESILFVKHQGCACTLTPVMYNWFKGWFQIGVTKSWLLEAIGIVPGRIEDVHPFDHPQRQSVVRTGRHWLRDVVRREHDPQQRQSEDAVVYAVYQVTETEYCDMWHRDTPATGHEDFHNAVFRIVTELHTLTTNPAQYR